MPPCDWKIAGVFDEFWATEHSRECLYQEAVNGRMISPNRPATTERWTYSFLVCLSGAVRQLSQCCACLGASDYAGHRTKNILVQQLLMLHQGSLGRTTIPGRERRAKGLLSTADSTRGMARVKHSGFRRLVFFLRSTLAPRRVSKEMDDEKVSKLRPRTKRSKYRFHLQKGRRYPNEELQTHCSSTDFLQNTCRYDQK